ncbi:MAG: hypothetical protein AB9903_10965 [Vulcanimicrobiota bacterium]
MKASVRKREYESKSGDGLGDILDRYGTELKGAAVGGAVGFAGLRKTIAALPTDEEKRKFLDRAIRKDKARLTAEMSARFVTMMSQIEQDAGFQEAPGKPHINPAA